MPVPFQYLEKFPLLQSLPQETLLYLSTLVSIRQFARREMVSSKEQSEFSLGFLLEGRLQGVDFTVDGRAVGLYFVEPGDYFGELSVIDGNPAAEHVIAASKSSALFLPAEPARRLIFENPALAQTVMSKLSSRVREVTAQRTLLALPNPFQRLCVQLLLLGRSSIGGEDLIDPAPTHQELAIMINSSRETVTRSFQLLILHEALARDGNALKLLRTDYLLDIGEGRIEPPKA
jgi:CRP/FNR family transcriptional regulator, cyclic AMP receptor protein